MTQISRTIMGKVSKDPELQVTTNGKPYTMFKLDVAGVNQEMGVPEVITINVKTWNDLAENVDRSIRVGTEVSCTGRWDSRPYTDKNGEQRTWIEFIAFQITSGGATLGNNGFKRSDKSFIPDPNADISPPEV
jgi:single-stranded DNA-binding protein